VVFVYPFVANSFKDPLSSILQTHTADPFPWLASSGVL